MKILVIDNYDSFTWNLVQYLLELQAQVEVVRNDELEAEQALARDAAGILISPGPSRPERAGISIEVVRRCAAAARPLLGVCLGHQSLAVAFGGQVVRADRVMHGKTSPILHGGKGLFAGLPSPFAATRYHSLIVEPEGLPTELAVSAWTAEGEIMGLAHRELPLVGVQFHPESILSEQGHELLSNFLALARQGGGP